MKVWVTPIVHMSAVVRGRWYLEPCQERYLSRVSQWMREGRSPPELEWERPPKGAILRPSLPQLWQWQLELREFDAIAIDIENAGSYLLCVGMTPLRLKSGALGRTLCLPFRTRGGGQYWRTRAELTEAVLWLNGVLSDTTLTKVFHFGLSHDVPFLRTMGFDVEGPIIDTAALAHTAFTEVPKGLQFLSTLYLGAPVWKRLVDDTDEAEEGKS